MFLALGRSAQILHPQVLQKRLGVFRVEGLGFLGCGCGAFGKAWSLPRTLKVYSCPDGLEKNLQVLQACKEH